MRNETDVITLFVTRKDTIKEVKAKISDKWGYTIEE